MNKSEIKAVIKLQFDSATEEELSVIMDEIHAAISNAANRIKKPSSLYVQSTGGFYSEDNSYLCHAPINNRD